MLINVQSKYKFNSHVQQLDVLLKQTRSQSITFSLKYRSYNRLLNYIFALILRFFLKKNASSPLIH